MLKFVVWITLSLGLVSPVYASQNELRTVDFVEIEDYVGRWYEVARLPQLFQPACTAVTAEYTLQEDGSISVVNKCKMFDPNFGIPIQVTGRAVPLDSSNSKLSLSFFNGRTNGQYWILELDEDYQWSLVGDPKRSSLYVLSRSSEIDPGLLDEILTLAQDVHGYNLENIVYTRHVRN